MTPAGAPGRWHGAGRLLRGSFGRLVSAQASSQAADGLAQITFAQVVLFEVGRGTTPWELTRLLAASLLPFSLVGPVAGVFVDRWDRRRILVTASVARACLMAASPMLLVIRSKPLAYVSIILLLSSSRFVLAAKGAGLPWTVPSNDLVAANSISALVGMSAAFAGAVAGSTFVAVEPAAGFISAAILYAGAAAVFARLSVLGGRAEAKGAGFTRVRREVAEEIATVARDAAIRTSLLAVWAHRFVLGAAFVVLVLVADGRYEMEASGYGLALIVTGIGAFIGTWLAPGLARRFSARDLLPMTFLPSALAAMVGGFAPSIAVLVAGVGVVALAFQVLKVLTDALLQELAPDVVRGRVFSVYDVLYNMAFVLAGLALVPVWGLGRESRLLWACAVAFFVFSMMIARAQRTWPFPRGPAYVATLRSRPRQGPRGLALLFGAAPVLAFPDADLGWVGFVGLVPLLLVVRTAPSHREAALRAWLGGTGFFVAMHSWLVPSVGAFTVVVGPALGLLWAPWGATAWVWMRDVRTPARLLGTVLVVPAFWVAVEFARSWDRLAGPWGLLGASQWRNLRFLSLAALGGVWLVSLALAMVNVGAAVAVSPRTPGRVRLAAAVVVGTVVLAGFGFGFARTPPGTVGTARVAGVQTGQMPASERFERHVRMSEDLAPSNLDLVVWGESSVGFDLETDRQRSEDVEELARTLGADVLVNVDARRGQAGGIFKSSLLIGPDGARGRYDKIRLVPFGEYVPLRFLFSWITAVTDAAQEDRHRGDGLAVLGTPLDDGHTLRIGPLVCFESAFPDMSRELARAGADLIVLQTATTTFQGSWGQEQHAALSAVRAVESGRPVIHAALSGVSAAFDARGRRLAWLDHDETGTYVVSIPLTSGRTPFVRFRDWVPALSLGILLAALLAAGLQAARREDKG